MSHFPIPNSQGRNQPLYERHMTKSGRNRVNQGIKNGTNHKNSKIPALLWLCAGIKCNENSRLSTLRVSGKSGLPKTPCF